MSKIVTPILTFVCGILMGSIYGYVLCNQSWGDAIEQSQNNMMWDQYR